MTQPQCARLIRIRTADGLLLSGLAAEPERPQGVIVHVHGKGGNFYENDFVATMCNVYPRFGLAFMSFNNRGSHVLTEAYVNGRLTYTGSAVEVFEDCVTDIDAALEEVRKRWNAPVLLQGHSLGCDKVLYYARQKRASDVAGIVLLSPADSYSIHRRWLGEESISQQVERLERDFKNDSDLIWNEYGVPGGEGYPIPITVKALKELLLGAGLQNIRYDRRQATTCQLPGFVYIGEADPLATAGIEVIRDYFSREFTSATLVQRPEGDHHFHGVEEDVVTEVAGWGAALTDRSTAPETPR